MKLLGFSFLLILFTGCATQPQSMSLPCEGAGNKITEIAGLWFYDQSNLRGSDSTTVFIGCEIISVSMSVRIGDLPSYSECSGWYRREEGRLIVKGVCNRNNKWEEVIEIKPIDSDTLEFILPRDTSIMNDKKGIKVLRLKRI